MATDRYGLLVRRVLHMALMKFRPPPTKPEAEQLVTKFRKAYPEHTKFVREVLAEQLRLTRREEIRKALKAGGSVPRAAELLGIGERTLWTWLQKDPEARKGIELPANRVVSAKKTL